MRTEAVGRPMAAVRDALPRLCLADDRDLLLRPARLGSKGAAAAPLALQAMTDRHANGLSLASSLKLSAAACCGSALYAHVWIPRPAKSTTGSVPNAPECSSHGTFYRAKGLVAHRTADDVEIP